ncbi:MAG: DUF2793 domain-containing protein [Phyllobacterium sp.]
MEQTTHLNLPYIMPSQAQKHVTHNEAIRALDALVQLSVLDRDLGEPPLFSDQGDRYIVASPATGAWAGYENQIASWQDGAWAFFSPQTGWQAWLADEKTHVVFDGNAWTEAFRVNPVPLLGIHAEATAQNRLTVKSNASLFDQETGDHRLVINKAGTPDTASLLLQQNYSGRAEIGLTGNDDLHIKSSPDGTTWRETLIAEADTGAVMFPNGIKHSSTGHKISSLVFTPGSDGEVSVYRNDTARGQNPRQSSLAAISGDLLTLNADVSSLFFHDFMRNVSCVRIWNISKAPWQPAWVKWNPAANQLQVTNEQDISGWLATEFIEIGDPEGVTPGRCIAVDISPMLERRLGAIFRQSGLLLKAGISGNGSVSLSVSHSGTPGSFLIANSPADGALHNECFIVPSTVGSPISGSNLIFIREMGANPTLLGTTILSVVGVFV